MLKTLATGFLTRKMARRVNRRTGNPLLRMAGLAAAGYVANRIVQGRRKTAHTQAQQATTGHGYASTTA